MMTNKFQSTIDLISENIKDVSLINQFDNFKVILFKLKNIDFLFQEENPNKYSLTLKLTKGDIKFSTEQFDVSCADFIKLKRTLLTKKT